MPPDTWLTLQSSDFRGPSIVHRRRESAAAIALFAFEIEGCVGIIDQQRSLTVGLKPIDPCR